MTLNDLVHITQTMAACVDWSAEDPARDLYEQTSLYDTETVRRNHEPDRPAAGPRQAGPGTGS